jgi:hypothetical protein
MTFELIRRGTWKNASTGWFIMLDEDYGKTYRVYRINRHGWNEPLRSPGGRATGFRTFDGAVKAANKAAKETQ